MLIHLITIIVALNSIVLIINVLRIADYNRQNASDSTVLNSQTNRGNLSAPLVKLRCLCNSNSNSKFLALSTILLRRVFC